MSREGIAAVLSFIVPGVGQIYNGDILRGLFWLIVTPGFWIGTGGTLGWACHLISAYTAHRRAQDKGRQIPAAA
jgi:TM2 domain-containing membrane protein YozV